ncbi:MAG: SdrD B-like domain-containing protein, partial [Gemmatimonadota bacterium]
MMRTSVPLRLPILVLVLALGDLLFLSCSDDNDRPTPLAPSFSTVEALASFGDRVWLDSDADGIQDAGEPGLEGVTVNLWYDGKVIQTTQTDAAGEYLFKEVEPNVVHTLEFVKPEHYVISPREQGSDRAADSDPDPTTAKTSVLLAEAEEDLTYDAGMYPMGSVVGKVWNDLDHDGIQDAGEDGVEGVAVHLQFLSVPGTVREAATDANGEFVFEGLPYSEPGPGGASLYFRLHVTAPDGHIFSPERQGDDPSIDSDVDRETGLTREFLFYPGSGQNPVDLDAGVFDAQGTVTGRVWEDLDKDGIQDPGESGVPGVTVQLLKLEPFAVPEEATTDENGEYSFAGLLWTLGDHMGPTHVYQLRVTPPDEHAFSPYQVGGDASLDSDVHPESGLSWQFAFAPGQVRDHMDAGVFNALASVRGMVWEDKDYDGIRTPQEDGVPGIRVNLIDATTGEAVDYQYTSSGGTYSFSGLPWGTEGDPAEYRLEFVVPEQFRFSPRWQGADLTVNSDAYSDGSSGEFALGAGQVLRFMDAGIWNRRSGVIGDRVWEDLNYNGIQDEGEPGIAGVEVELYDTDSHFGAIASTSTDVDGYYRFSGLDTGLPATGGPAYKVCFSYADGPDYGFSPRGEGTDRDADSNVERSTGCTGPGYLLVYPYQEVLSMDAGMINYASGSIGDRVWEDLNYNGIQDEGEPGIAGVEVELYDTDSHFGAIASTSTDVDGYYRFSGLDTGLPATGGPAYKVCFSYADGPDYGFSPRGEGTDRDADSNVEASTGCTGPGYLLLYPYEEVLSMDAGMIDYASGSIGDRVWEDWDYDGVQDPEEPGIGGVQVDLYRPGGMPVKVAETFTSPDGSYSFTGLDVGLPGTGGPAYKPCFHLPTDFEFTKYHAPEATLATNSDADPTDGCTDYFVVLYPYDPVESIDAGMVNRRSASVGDLVWEDLDRDGIQDQGEPGLSGVKVEILEFPGGGALAETNTDGNGRYQFSNLPGGLPGPDMPPGYQIRFTRPAHYVLTAADHGTDDTKDSDALGTGVTAPFGLWIYEDNTTVDAGLVATGTLVVWKETNPAGGVGFSFEGSPDLGAFTLDDAGEKRFEAIPTGTYTLTEDDPGPEYGLTKINCDAAVGAPDLKERTVDVEVGVGATVKCVFENQARGTISISKVTNPADAARGGFVFTHDIPAPESAFSLDHGGTQTFQYVPAGAYHVTEGTPAPFHELGAITCKDPGDDGTTWDVETQTASIDLDPGETVSCEFRNDDLPPEVQVTPDQQTVQYSDGMQEVLIVATDAAADGLRLDTEWSSDGVSFSTGLPDFLELTSNSCTYPSGTRRIACSWKLSGAVGLPNGTYVIRATATDEQDQQGSADLTLVVAPESATVSFDDDNPPAVLVAEAGGDSGPFTLTVGVEETEPDEPTGSA